MIATRQEGEPYQLQPILRTCLYLFLDYMNRYRNSNGKYQWMYIYMYLDKLLNVSGRHWGDSLIKNHHLGWLLGGKGRYNLPISTVPLLSPEAKRLQLGYTGNAHTAQARFDGL